ncbi:cobalamin biosynthesis protein, partial [Pseudomonas sp. HMWF010]
MSLVLSTCAGVVLDAILGEPKGWHPLVAFGRMAERIEQRFNPAGGGWRSHGVSAWCLAVLPLTLLAWLLSEISGLGWAVEIIALYA